MRRFLSLLLPLSLGLVLAVTACDPDGPGGGSGNDAGSEDSGPDAGSDTDAGVDAGTTDGGVDAGSEEPAGDPCTASDPQPTTCGYGSFCGSRGTCQTVPPPDCENFRNFPVSWDPATASGPVTYAAELLSYAVDERCPPTLPMRVRTLVRAYSPSGGLPTDPAGLSKVFSYVRVNGSTFSDSGQFSNVVTSEDGKNTEFQVGTCFRDQQPSVSLGFYFEGGNGLCQIVTQ